MEKNRGITLRGLIARPEGVFAFGAMSATGAIAATMAGSECIYVGGYAASAVRGFPDMGIMTMTEMLQHTKYISDAVNVPVVCDIDDGYGSVHNAMRTAREFLETTKISGIHIEDQKYPKRCGHIAGKELLSIPEFLGKLKAVIDVRNELDPSRLVIARTDAFSAAGSNKDSRLGGDIEEAIKRAMAYADCGADSVWCEFPNPDCASAEAFSEGVKKRFPKLPLSFNISPSFLDWHLRKNRVTDEKLIQMGYKFRFSTYPELLIGTFATYFLAGKFRDIGLEALVEFREMISGLPVENIMKVIGVDRYQEIEQRYSPEAALRIELSDGFKKDG